jgi:hypothetical protein
MMIPEVEKHDFKSAIIVGIEVQLLYSLAILKLTSVARLCYADYPRPPSPWNHTLRPSGWGFIM